MVIQLASIVMFYTDYRNDPNYQITVEKVKPLIAYLGEEGIPTDLFFEGIIITGLQSPYNNWHFDTGLVEDIDIQWWMQRLFYEGDQLKNLDHAVGWAKNILSKTKYKLRVYIAIPYTKTSTINPSLYVDTVITEWEKLDPINLELAGFYWIPEDYSASFIAKLKEFSAKVHEKHLKVINIFYMRAEGVSNWKKYGVDYAVQQPNYAYYDETRQTTLDETNKILRDWELAGVHLEFAKWITNPHAGTFLESANLYLDVACEYGWNKNILNTFYHGTDIASYGSSIEPEVRAIYDRIYQFVKDSRPPLSNGNILLPLLILILTVIVGLVVFRGGENA